MHTQYHFHGSPARESLKKQFAISCRLATIPVLKTGQHINGVSFLVQNYGLESEIPV